MRFHLGTVSAEMRMPKMQAARVVRTPGDARAHTAGRDVS